MLIKLFFDVAIIPGNIEAMNDTNITIEATTNKSLIKNSTG